MTTSSETSSTNRPLEVAFAVGGLGGNNCHGAGFLQAALDTGIKPQLISFTSGQVLWVSRYLAAMADSSPNSILRKQLAEDIEALESFHQPDFDLLFLGLFGKRGAIRPARHEVLLDVIKNMTRSFERMIENPRHIFFMKEFMSTLPARQIVMDFSDEFFQAMSDVFNGCSDIGLVFNSFDPSQGMEIVHLNDRAKEILEIKAGDKASDKAGDQSSYRTRTLYKDIKPQYVRDALWIYQYGFEDNSMLDGAFYRQIILSEVAPARTIFVARPINYKWLGSMPNCMVEVEDMKLEMAFNGSYQGERDKLMLINRLIADGILSGTKYHKIELQEIEPETQESFFDYIFENLDVFDRAREKAKSVFARHLAGKEKAPAA